MFTGQPHRAAHIPASEVQLEDFNRSHGQSNSSFPDDDIPSERVTGSHPIMVSTGGVRSLSNPKTG